MKSTILAILLFPTIAIGQIDRTRTWVFGQSIGLKFTKTGSIDTLTGIFKPADQQYEGTGVYNDSNGNLVYYALNGQLIGDDNLPKNTTFAISGGYSASQANIITSLNDSIFHIFGTTSGYNYYYSCFDRIANKFKSAGKSLIYRASEAQALVNHQNGKWQWVVCHSRLGDTLYSFLITENGLESCPVISHAGPFYQDWYPGQGCMKFSPDGKYFVLTTWSAEKVVIGSFNNQTGQLKEIVSIPGLVPYGVEFMEKKLFVSSTRLGKIHEFDFSKLDLTNLQNSKRIVYDTLDDVALGQILRAPNGKLYVAYFESKHLGVIENKSGTWSHSYTGNMFGSKLTYAGFPSFNASYFHTPALNFNYARNCKTNTFKFNAIDTIKANYWQWKFSKGNREYSGTGNQANFTFPDSGLWHVRCIAGNGSREDTVVKSIEILKPLTRDYLGDDILLPKGANLNGSIAGPEKMHCLHWQKMGDTVELKMNDYKFSDTGTFICRATNAVFCTYTDTIRVRVCDSFARAAVIERKGDSLFAKTWAFNYQWYMNDTVILNATTPALKLYKKGIYKLRTWNSAACDSVSSAFEVTKLNLRNSETGNFRISPNPSTGDFQITSSQIPIFRADIYSAEGRKLQENLFSGTKQAFISLPATQGLYLVQVNGTYWEKIWVL